MRRRIPRRAFLAGLFGAATSTWLPRAGWPAARSLRRDRRYPRRPFVPFPEQADTGIYGVGTHQMGPNELLLQALEGGSRLLATSPDYRNGYIEKQVGWAVAWVGSPVFLLAQIPTRAWEGSPTVTGFQREFRRSMGHLRRGNVEAYLVRNAGPDQITHPRFREFASLQKRAGYVKHMGVSGHGPDLEPVLERVLEDDLLDIVLFGAHLARFQRVPELLAEARARGKLLVAMKSREAALQDRVPGWEAEKERRRHSPWDGTWDPRFSRRALEQVMRGTPAHNAVLSLRLPEDVALILGREIGGG